LFPTFSWFLFVLIPIFIPILSLSSSLCGCIASCCVSTGAFEDLHDCNVAQIRIIKVILLHKYSDVWMMHSWCSSPWVYEVMKLKKDITKKLLPLQIYVAVILVVSLINSWSQISYAMLYGVPVYFLAVYERITSNLTYLRKFWMKWTLDDIYCNEQGSWLEGSKYSPDENLTSCSTWEKQEWPLSN
jgi:hypothetical protein